MDPYHSTNINEHELEVVVDQDGKMKTRVKNYTFHKKKYSDITFCIPTRYIPIGNQIIISGGEGTVMLAHDRETHKDVAIKKRTINFKHPYTAKRTHREFVLTQMTNHKNVVKLLNAFTPHQHFNEFSDVYFVTEFVSFPLKYLIDQRHQVFDQPNGAEVISYLMYQLLCGIRHLHRAGIFHRDLTPSNIVVNKKSQLKIIDLGTARPDLSETSKPVVTGYVGMRFYRAPEIVLGIDMERFESCMLYDRKVDLWSAGCILVEMITGKPIFPGFNNLDQWNKIIQIVGSPQENFIQQLPDGIKNFVQNAPKYEPQSWAKLIPDNTLSFAQPQQEYRYPRCTLQAARELILKLLVIDPVLRISVDQALEHPYVMWQHEPGELENESSPYKIYDGYIEELELTENEWKTLIFAELKQYELMKAQESDTDEQKRQECQKCVENRCGCNECNKMNLGELLK